MYVTRQRARTRRGGFSLLELLIVLAIIGVIAAMVVPQLLGRQQDAMIKTTEASIHNLEQALNFYAVDHNAKLPQESEGGLQLLLEPLDSNNQPREPYLDEIPKDAWGHPLEYQYPPQNQELATKPDIWSWGPNEQDDNGGDDDINNWDVDEDL